MPVLFDTVEWRITPPRTTQAVQALPQETGAAVTGTQLELDWYDLYRELLMPNLEVYNATIYRYVRRYGLDPHECLELFFKQVEKKRSKWNPARMPWLRFSLNVLRFTCLDIKRNTAKPRSRLIPLGGTECVSLESPRMEAAKEEVQKLLDTMPLELAEKVEEFLDGKRRFQHQFLFDKIAEHIKKSGHKVRRLHDILV